MLNCQWPPWKIFSRRKTTGLFIFTTAKLQPSQTSKSKAKSQISYSKLGLVKLDLQKKSSFIILILLIRTLTQCFPYWNSPWIEWGEVKTHGLHWWKNMPCVGIKDFGRNTTQYTVMNHRIMLLNQTWGPYKLSLKWAGGRLSRISQCCMEHVCHNSGWWLSQRTCLWTNHAFWRLLWPSRTDLALSNRSKWSSQLMRKDT